MKKFLTSVFMLSMVLFSMNVFNSCKDYDEDEYNDLIVEFNKNDASLKTWITTSYATISQLKDSIAAVQARLDACCTNATNMINGKADTATVNGKADAADVRKLVDSIADLRTADKVLQAQIDSLNALLSDTTTGVVTNIVTVLGKVTDINTTVTNLGASLTALQNNTYTKPQVDSLLNLYTTKADFLILESKVNTVVAEAAKALALAKNDSIRIDEFSKVANEALQRAKNDSIAIANLIPEVNEALQRAKNDSVLIANLTPQVKEAFERAKNDSIWIEDLKTRVTNLETYTEQLDAAIKTAVANSQKADSLLQNQIDALAVGFNDIVNKHLADLDGAYKDADQLLQDSIDAVAASVKDILDNKIPTLEQAYKDADQLLQDSIDALALQVKQNTEDIEALNDSIDKIMGRLDKVDEALKSLITGIIIQATANPVYGTFNLPFGINSNVLMAFYGTNDNPVVFPTKETANYVKNSQTFTEKDWAMISGVSQYRKAGNSTLFNSNTGNAGTVYLTVNPGSVDFAGQTLELVNSKDQASKIALAPLKKENDVELKFGYTRAAETNGFYSAQATLSEEDINAVKINIQDGLGAAFKSVLTEHTYQSVGSLATKLYSQFDGILPAQGLKASWTDYNGDHSVYSQYGIAATAIKPLSFAFLENLNVQTVPGYERAIALVDRVASEIQGRLPKQAFTGLAGDIANLSIKHIELAELDDDVRAKFNITYNDYITISGMKVNLNINPEIEVPIEFTANAEVDLAGMNITFPSIVVQTKVENKDNPASANLIVPVDGMPGQFVTIPLGKIAVYGQTDDPTSITISSGKKTIEVPIKETVKAKVKISEVIDLGEQTIKINNLHVNMTDAVDDLWSQVAKQIGGVNNMIDGLDKIMDDVNDLIDQVNDALDDSNGYVAKAADRVKSYIDRLNTKMASVLNTANQRIQPVLLMENGGAIKRVSRSKGVPSYLKSGTVAFLPTTYTAEIVTPAFKKHIAVINVLKNGKSAQGGDADCKAKLDAVNAQDKMNTVLDGDKCTVVATFQPGYLYVIAYSALDYSGKISMRKYYVQY